MSAFESPYLYHLADASLFTVAKVIEVTCDEASCVTWCMELWKAEFKIGHIVEIDETSLAKKRKYNRGRVYQEYWLFGGVERATHQNLVGHIRDEQTLSTASEKHELKGMRVSSHECESFPHRDLPVGIAQQWLEISDVTAIDWYSFCRDVCSKKMLRCNMEIGGPGHIVEIDETSLKKKSKYGRGRQHEDNWLFGGFDRTTNLWFGALTGADRKKNTLSPILRKYMKAGATILSDQFASYFFVDPVTGVHTNRIEGVWEVCIKRHLKRMRGIRKDLLPGYLGTFLEVVVFRG
eukprot:jgi/Phyca11/21817/fgenesh1_pg.PHYCAscaffold_130_\